MTTLPYDPSYRPPAPTLPVGVSALGPAVVMLPMLIDTGADVTLIPAALARQLRLPRVDTVIVSGFGGATQRADVHAATLHLGGTEVLARVVATDEALLGRDVLAAIVFELDGPRAQLTVRPRPRPRRRGPRAS